MKKHSVNPSLQFQKMSERKLGYWEDKVRKIDMQIQNEGKKMILNIKNILFIICFNNLVEICY